MTVITKKSIRKLLMIVSIVLGTLLVGIGSYAGYLIHKADTAIQRIASPTTVQPDEIEDSTDIPGNTDLLKPVIFLLVGVDNREGSGGAMNTDVNMLISFNPQAHTASMLSLPRDLLIKSKTMSEHKTNYYYAHFYNKDKASAIPNTKQFFSDLFHLPIDYMTVMNFDSLREIVDTLGGLEINVDMDMKYTDTADGTHIDLKKGLQTLDGQLVLDFVRYRKSNQGTQESSDFARNDRQQQVIKQIVDKMSSFQGVKQWGSVLDIIGNNVKTDVAESDLRQWIFNFPNIRPTQIHSFNLDAQWISPYVYVDEDSLQHALDALRAEVGLPSDDSLHLQDIIGVIPSK